MNEEDVIYTQWNITQPSKRMNNVICSNMDGPRDYHTKQSKSERERQMPCAVTYLGFPGGTSGKEPTCQCRRHRRLELDPWSGKIPGGGDGNSLQYPCLGNPMDRRAWRAMVHRVAKRSNTTEVT